MGGSSNPISFDNQFRCHVYGWALTAILAPQIRQFVSNKVKADYKHVVEAHGINAQDSHQPLRKWPATFKRQFRYENINGNARQTDQSKFKYDVSSHVDFARMYFGRCATEFFVYEDESDPCFLLSALSKGPFFPSAARIAGCVKRRRDDWAHCSYRKWSLNEFRKSFEEMKQLVVKMNLDAEIEKKICGELDMWETIGTDLQLSFVHPAVLQKIQEKLKSLQGVVDNMCVERNPAKTTLQHGLQMIKDRLENKITNLETRMDYLEANQEVMMNNNDQFRESIRHLQGRTDALARSKESDKRSCQESSTGKSRHKRQRTEVTEPAIASLARIAERLEEVEFAGCNLGDDDACLIAESLKCNGRLKILNLADNCIGDVGAAGLAASLEKKTCLEKVNLSGNKINAVGARALGKALEGVKSLKSCNFGNNCLGRNGDNALAENVKGQSSQKE